MTEHVTVGETVTATVPTGGPKPTPLRTAHTPIFADRRPASTAGLVLVDDHRRFREATAAALGRDPGLQILGQGRDADEALSLARQLRPALMLLDITMPGDGLCAAHAIRAECPEIHLVMLTFSSQEHHLRVALAAGVRGYVLKGVGGRDLRRIVQAVLGGETYLAPEVEDLLLPR